MVPENPKSFSVTTGIPVLDSALSNLSRTQVYIYGDAAPFLSKFIFEKFVAEDGTRTWDSVPNGFIDPGTRCRLVVFDQCFTSQDDERKFNDYLKNGPEMCFGIHLSRGNQSINEPFRMADVAICAQKYGSSKERSIIKYWVVKHRYVGVPPTCRYLEFPVRNGEIVLNENAKEFFVNENDRLDPQLVAQGQGRRARVVIENALRREERAKQAVDSAIQRDSRLHRRHPFFTPMEDIGILPGEVKEKPWLSQKSESVPSHILNIAKEYYFYAQHIEEDGDIDFMPPAVSEFIDDIENHYHGSCPNGLRSAMRLVENLDAALKDKSFVVACQNHFMSNTHNQEASRSSRASLAQRQYEWYINCLFDLHAGRKLHPASTLFVDAIESRTIVNDLHEAREEALDTYIALAKENRAFVANLGLHNDMKRTFSAGDYFNA